MRYAHRKRRRVAQRSVLLLFLLGTAIARAGGLPSGSAIGRAAGVVDPWQIEADWLRQAEVRTPGEQQGQAGPSSIALVVQRGLKLAGALERLGIDVQQQVRTLKEVAGAGEALPAEAASQRWRQLYLKACWAVRRLALSNPLLDFDDLLFVKRVPGSYAHMSDQYYGWFSRPGGGLFVLEDFRSGGARRRCLTAELPPGSVLGPDLSYDADKVLFAYARYYPHLASLPNKVDKSKIPEDAFYHVYQVHLDGSGLRRLTRGKYDDFDARYLPDGRIVFLSTRRGQFVQCTAQAAAESLAADLPDAYMRCGGGPERPAAIYTLHIMDGQGRRMRAISPFESFEWNPYVADDGRIIYSRWDYVDRKNTPYMSLWSTLPDGTGAQAIFGNYTVSPLGMFEARSIPHSPKLIFTASAHHSITGGSLVLLDPRKGADEPAAMTRLTPEVPFPEAEGWPDSYYATPYPLSEDYYLVAWSDQRLIKEDERRRSVFNPPNALGLYLYDAFGNLNLIYRDPDISSLSPIPVRPRPRPPAIADGCHVADAQRARMLVLDVYQGLPNVPRGAIRRLRLVGVPPKTQPVMDFPQLGVTHDDAGKFVLGTVPVEPDGSALFWVPSGVPFFVQALDAEGMAVQTMRSVAYAQPGQTSTCIGCHEHRHTAPPNRPALAARREPSKIVLGPEGSWPLDFRELVRPVLDRHCVRCHQPGQAGGKIDLTPGFAYSTLIGYGEQDGFLEGHVWTRYLEGRSTAGACGARSSALLRLLKQGHYGQRLSGGDMERLITWMDTYAQRAGSFGPDQVRRLRRLRQRLAPLLEQPD